MHPIQNEMCSLYLGPFCCFFYCSSDDSILENKESHNIEPGCNQYNVMGFIFNLCISYLVT